MDAGDFQCNTSSRVSGIQYWAKKKGRAEAPPFFTRLLESGLVTAVFGGRRVRVATCARARIGEYNRQVTHGEIACTNIADERKAVSVLEVANRNHVALEARNQCLRRVHVDITTV